MNKEFEESLSSFIDDRLSTEFYRLKEDKSYKKAKKQYDNFYNQLSDKQKEEIDELLALYANLGGCENNFAYRLGMNDSLQLFQYNFKSIADQ